MDTLNPRDFEVFISYKNSDGEGELTQDAKLAFALHDKLEEAGIRSFCSTLSLTRMGQSAYKDAINQALDAAKVMIVVGTTLDNILSPWVKYEWGTFHDDLLTGRKPNGTLVSYISGLDPNVLPRELRSYESFPLEQGGDTRIVEFVRACMENEVEFGYAGTKPKKGIGVIGAAARHGLVNAKDPDTPSEPPKKKSKRGIIIAAVVVLVIALCGACGYAYYSQQKAAEEQAAAQAAAEQQRLEEEQKAAEEAAKQTSYTIRFEVKGTDKTLKAEKTVEGVEVGDVIKEKAPAIKGYTPTKESVQIKLAKESGDNVITFYYTKKTTPKPAAEPSKTPSTPSGDSGGSGTGSGGGSSSSDSGSSSRSDSNSGIPKGAIID